MKRIPAALLFIFLCASLLPGQKVQLKRGVLLLDGKPFLAYTVHRRAGNKIYVYTDLQGHHEYWQAHFCLNRTQRGSDDYRHYYFPDIEMEMILPRRKKYRFRHLLPKMLETSVIDREGNLYPEALRTFVKKWHVPLPESFGDWIHVLPVVNEESGKVHDLESKQR